MIPKLRHPNLHPFAGLDIAHLIASRAKTRADHLFLIWEPFDKSAARSWTYSQFYSDVRRIAAGLKAKNVKTGDRVLIHLENCPENLLTWYACVYLGAVAVTTNSNSVASELKYFMSMTKVVGAVTQPKLAEQIKDSGYCLNWLAITETDAGTQADSYEASHNSQAFSELYGNEFDVSLRPADPSMDAGIQFTSGTTSRPKGVVWTHANVLWGAKTSATHEALRPDDVHLVFMPLFHTNAQSYSIFPTIWAGASAVLQPRYSASRFWEVALRHKCTWVSLGPFMIRTLMQQPVPEHHFRVWGGPYVHEIEEHFKVQTIGWWGMTETITHGILTDPLEPSVSTSIGRPSSFYEIAILRDDGSPADFGETGDLRIKGVPGLSLFKEYLNNPEATESAYDDDGWFITGDRVTLLDNGDIMFSERSSDLLKVGAESVSASEIERIVMAVPGVAECAVVGKPDDLRDEVPVAFVIPSDGDTSNDALITRINETCCSALAEFKRPKEIFLEEDFPRVTVGKVVKAELKKRFEP